MIPFYKQEEYDDSMDEEVVNPNLYVTMADYVSNRIWSPNVNPWQETLPWQIP